MKKLFSLAILGVTLAVLLGGLGLAADKAERKDNTAPEGFTLLFNGKNLDGWQAAIDVRQREKLSGEALEKAQKAANDKALPHWTVEEGVLVNDGKGGNLATVKDFTDFELLADWKIETAGDSGIYLRGVPQVQIWDSDVLKGNLEADKGKGSGGLWNNPKGSKGKDPLKKADKAPGEWNSFRILMRGEEVTVYLNGELVVDKAPLTAYKPLPAKGPIELQQHPKQDGTLGKIQFKNIYIKELDK
jgi:hypothetical protein